MQRSTHSGATISVLLFFVFFLAGSGYIVIAKLYDLHPGIVTFIPVGIMILYALLAKLLRGFALRDDQTGDNCYYLGFLYTLTSLGMSLYQFDDSGSGEQIVRNFGIAVGSTIAGVALRVLFHQMRHDPEDVEAASRMALAESARRVKRELDATVREMAHFRRVSEQQVSEGFLEIQQDIDRVADKLVGTVDSLQKRYQRLLNDSADKSTHAIADLAKSGTTALSLSARVLDDEQHKLVDSTKRITAALDQVSEKLHRMRTPEETIAISLQPFIQDLSGLLREVAERSDASAERQNQILAELKTLNQRLAQQMRSAEGQSR